MFREYFLALLINPYNLSSSLLATAILRALSIISGLNVLRLLTNISKASSNIGLVSSLWVFTFFRRTWNGRTARESLGYFLFLFDFIFPLPKSASRLWGPQLCLWNVFGWNIWQGFQGKDQFLSYTAMTRFVWVWHDLIIISWNHCLSRTLLKVKQTDLLKKYSTEVGVEGINVDFLPSKDCSEDVCDGCQGLSTE